MSSIPFTNESLWLKDYYLSKIRGELRQPSECEGQVKLRVVLDSNSSHLLIASEQDESGMTPPRFQADFDDSDALRNPQIRQNISHQPNKKNSTPSNGPFSGLDNTLVSGQKNPEVVKKSLPDTLVWLDDLVYNDPFVNTYFRFPSYKNYPVVGVSWTQANAYAKWRTDRVNEMLLIEKGILNPNPDQKDNNNFTTDAYLVGQYEANVRRDLKDLGTGESRKVRFEDGILLPDYRLPTEAEWEYAALGLRGKQASEEDELYTDRRLFPWDGNTTRYEVRDKNQGAIMANFKRGKGDYMGIAGKLNDNAHIPAEVRSFLPNDFGLYNMAGNVNEWVLDVYRPLTSLSLRDADNHDLNPYRGDGYRIVETDQDGKPVEKDSLGRLRYRKLTSEELANRSNVREGQLNNFSDGDSSSAVTYDSYHTLISDRSRVYKGGSWADRTYWLSPGTRRFKDQDDADRTIGFRCAMTRLGSPAGNSLPSGNQFKTKGKKVDRRYK